MRKQLLAIFLSLALLVGILPTTALAAAGTYEVKLHVSEETIGEKNFLEVGFGIQSDDLTIRTGQGIVFAVDLNTLDFVAKNGATATESIDTLPNSTPLNSNKYTFSKYEDQDEDFTSWNCFLYYSLSADGQTGYIIMQPMQNDAAEHIQTEVILASVLLGFKEGKSKADLTSDSVRLATYDEAKGLNQGAVVTVTNGDDIYQKYLNTDPSDGSADLGVTPVTVWADGILPSSKTLESIKVVTPPTKTEYTEGEIFDPAGMVIHAAYSDGSEAPVTGYTYTPDAALTTSDSTITISYTEDSVTKTCTQAITVTAAHTHTYDREVVAPEHLKTEATCTSPAVYYKSCTCGANGTDTFTDGSALGHAESGWQTSATEHWKVCTRSRGIWVADQRHRALESLYQKRLRRGNSRQQSKPCRH